MAMFSGRQPVANRITEMIETLKNELTNVSQEATHYKMQCEDLERKILSQIGEIKQVHISLTELELRHNETQRKYEELMRMQNLRSPNDQVQNGNLNQREREFTFVNFPSIGKLDTSANKEFQQLGKRRFPEQNGSDSLPRLQIPNKISKIESAQDSQMTNDSKLMIVNSNSSLPTNTILPNSNPNLQQNYNQPQPQPQPQPRVEMQPNILPTFSSITSSFQSKDQQPQPPSLNNSSNSMLPSNSNQSLQSPINPPMQVHQSQSLPGQSMPSPMAPTASLSQPLPSSIPQSHQNSNIQPLAPISSTIPQSMPSIQPQSNPASGLSAQSTSFIEENTPDYRVTRLTSGDSTINLELAHEFDHASVVCCVKFSKDGKYLATGSNKKAQIFSVAEGTRVATFSESGENSRDLYLRSVCFSPDGKYLACGAEDKTIKLWDVERKSMVHVFNGHSLDIYSLDYSNDGRFIVSGSGDKKARFWDVENRKCLFTLGNDEVGPKDGVTSVAISPDGRLIAAGSLDRIIRLWDTQTGYFLERYEGHSDSVYSVAFSPDGKSLASGSLDKTLKIWDLSECRSRSRCKSVLSGHSDFVLSVAYSGDGNCLVSGSKDRSVVFWDTRTSTYCVKLEGHKNSVISVAVNPVNGTLATGSGDCKAKIWKYSRF